MLRWVFVAMHLLAEASAARRDARIRFLKASCSSIRVCLSPPRFSPMPHVALRRKAA